MNFQTATQDGYKQLREIFGDAYVDPIKYIEFMASTMHKNIADWELFLDANGKPHTDRKTINQCFMERLAAPSPAAPAPSVAPISDADRKRIMELSARESVAELNNLKSTLVGIENDMTSYTRNYHTKLGQYREYSQKVDNFVVKTNDSFLKQVESVCAQGFYKWAGLDANGRLNFETVGDLILSHQNKAALIDMSVNLGRFKIIADAFTLQVWVKPLERNIVLYGKVHPHVNNSGEICWGTLSDLFKRAAKNGDFVSVMNAVRDLITSYNHDNPYVALVSYYYAKAIHDMDRTKAWSSINGAGQIVVNENSLVLFRDNMRRLTQESNGAIVNPFAVAPHLDTIMSGKGGNVRFIGGALTADCTPIGSPSGVTVNVNGTPYYRTIKIENPDWDEDDADSPEYQDLDLFGPRENDDDETYYEDFQGENYDEDGEQI